MVETCYAILVLILPDASGRVWSSNEMEIVEVVADQVAVALSHAAVLEESQLMREKLEEQNRVLQRAKENAMMASQARDSFQKVMSRGMRRPMHSILGLTSMFQNDNVSSEQRIIVDTMVKASSILSTLINDVLEISDRDNGKFPLEMRPFQLHSVIREASCLVKCLFIYQGFSFSMEVPRSMPNQVMGDESRTFQVLLHMIGHLLNVCDGGGSVIFRVALESGNDDRNYSMWRPSSNEEYVGVKFEVEVNNGVLLTENSMSKQHIGSGRYNSNEVKEGLSFGMCRKLVKMMQGNIWVSSDSGGQARRMTLVLKFQIVQTPRRHIYEHGNAPEQPNSNSMFRGLQVVLADDDDVNRMVTKKLLEKLGCQVTAVSSGFQCLSALSHSGASCEVVVLDLHMPEMDGFEVAMRIRKFRSRNWPFIIALTASTEEHVRERCLQMGMNGLIRKPVLLTGLADELRRVMRRTND